MSVFKSQNCNFHNLKLQWEIFCVYLKLWREHIDFQELFASSSRRIWEYYSDFLLWLGSVYEKYRFLDSFSDLWIGRSSCREDGPLFLTQSADSQWCGCSQSQDQCLAPVSTCFYFQAWSPWPVLLGATPEAVEAEQWQRLRWEGTTKLEVPGFSHGVGT